MTSEKLDLDPDQSVRSSIHHRVDPRVGEIESVIGNALWKRTYDMLCTRLRRTSERRSSRISQGTLT